MQSAQGIPRQVLETLAQGGTVLCANARAARALSGLYAAHVTASQARRAWETPRILDWKQWLHEQWQHLLLTGKEDRILLSPLQEELLWNEIVQPAVEGRSLIAPADLARQSMIAYALIITYNAGKQLQRGKWDHASLEPELFRKWAIAMESRCSRNHWLSEAKLSWSIADAIRDGRLQTPTAIAWNGFDVLTTADTAMREVLAECGCVQSDVVWQLNASERLISAPGLTDELEACALWVRGQLDQSPSTRIGIVLPDLESRRADVDRVFRRRLSPEASGLMEYEPQPIYEFTLGLPLAHTPAVAAALTLLRWCAEPLEQERITWMMTTGFFGRNSDAQRAVANLAAADREMRKKLTVPELPMEDALERLSNSRSGSIAVASWVRSMRNASAVMLREVGKRYPCAQWIVVIASILKQAGWPGDRTVDSVGYQVLDRWQRALDEISALNLQSRRYEYGAFLKLLDAHLQASIFAPESEGARVTISGMLESAGQSFDAVWILGATDAAWPAASRMHPLIPSWLQLELEMPGSSAQRDRLLASAVLQRLRDSSREMTFSWSRESAQGAQRPSSLIGNLLVEQPVRPALTLSVPLETFADEMTVPWPGGRSAGGQEVLKHQSACPFQAFATKRLGASELPSLETGLNAKERGSLTHNVLERVWADPRMLNSEQLRAAIFNDELPAIVQEHVARAFEEYDHAASMDWERKYLSLEKSRVAAVVLQWLHYENQRMPFEVDKFEKKEAIVIADLELNVRMDRIDKVAGGRVLIDYKTGKLPVDAWEGDRLAEPQLPIYAISGKIENLRDVLFAQVRGEGTKYLSAVYGAAPDLFPQNAAHPDAMATFQAKCDQWTQALDSLSRDFQIGIATVDPRDGSATCKHCNFPGLCRIAESSSGSVIAEDDEPWE